MSRKVINTIISSNVYFVKNDEIKNIQLKKVKDANAFFIPAICNATVDTSILKVNFQTDNSEFDFVFYIQILPFIGPSRTILFYLNDTAVQGPTINSTGIYKIAPNESKIPIILKLD